MKIKKLNAAVCSLTMVVSLSLLSPLASAAPGDRGASDSPRVKINRIFAALDTDFSETITLDEWLARVSERASNQFTRIDADGDDLISLAEFLAIGGQADQDDTDRDAIRACVESELGVTASDPVDKESKFAELDVDGSGFVDQEEFLAGKTDIATERFMIVDADGDGAISKEELASAFSNNRERRAIRRACIAEQREAVALLNGDA